MAFYVEKKVTTSYAYQLFYHNGYLIKPKNKQNIEGGYNQCCGVTPGTLKQFLLEYVRLIHTLSSGVSVVLVLCCCVSVVMC